MLFLLIASSWYLRCVHTAQTPTPITIEPIVFCIDVSVWQCERTITLKVLGLRWERCRVNLITSISREPRKIVACAPLNHRDVTLRFDIF